MVIKVKAHVMTMTSSPNLRVKTIDVRPGLAVLRYTSADAVGAPPVLRVTSPAGEARVELIGEPAAAESELTHVGQCMVLKASQESRLAIQILPRAGHSSNITLALEYLTTSREAEDRLLPDPEAPGLSILGHISRLGDRRVRDGQWLAGPERPLPIEGLQIERPSERDGVMIWYGASDASPSRTIQMVEAGIFVGSRGRARPLRGLMLELRGPNANKFQIDAETLFLGAPLRKVSGSSLKLSGPTGNEPLTGLKISLSRDTDSARRKVITQPDSMSESHRESASRVLVFR
jgi:hypothetical protein